MKSTLFALLTASGFAGAAVAAPQPAVSCVGDNGLQVSLTLDANSDLASLTYGKAGALTTITGVETSLVNGVGSAVKGNDVMLVITPAPGKNIGELIIAGETFHLTCK